MAQTDATLKAQILSKLDRKGYYCPKSMRVENIPAIVPFDGEETRVRNAAREMAESAGVPLRYKDSTVPTVCLMPGKNEEVHDAIHSLDPDEAEAGQGDGLRVIRR